VKHILRPFCEADPLWTAIGKKKKRKGSGKVRSPFRIHLRRVVIWASGGGEEDIRTERNCEEFLKNFVIKEE